MLQQREQADNSDSRRRQNTVGNAWDDEMTFIFLKALKEESKGLEKLADNKVVFNFQGDPCVFILIG